MIFTIDNDNDIRAHETEVRAEEAAKLADGTILVRTGKELSKAVAEWPASRLMELWNSFAGVAPFTDCKPVKKFATRDKAVARIWGTILRLGSTVVPKPAEEVPTEAKKGGKPKAANGAKPAPKAKANKRKKAAAGSRARARTKPRSSRCSSAKAVQRWRRSWRRRGGRNTRSAGSSASWAARAG